ncbi:hypothetical protein EGW08_002824, partial [Elysia chlorotica]
AECPRGILTCDNGTCISPDYVCDGNSDCFDKKDEASCARCTRLEHPLCNNMGFTESRLPNKVFNCDDNDCLKKEFDKLLRSMDESCVNTEYFYCAYVFHGCLPARGAALSSPEPVLPCYEACTAARDYCYSQA